MGVLRVAKWGLWVVLGTLGAVGQGLAVFWYMEPHGPFIGRAGLQCTGIPLLIELVLLVVTLKNFDQIHASAVSNPHSLIGQSLRNDAHQSAAAPPPTRTAWDGEWEDANHAADKMSGKP
jgi:hypothetical protein